MPVIDSHAVSLQGLPTDESMSMIPSDDIQPVPLDEVFLLWLVSAEADAVALLQMRLTCLQPV